MCAAKLAQFGLATVFATHPEDLRVGMRGLSLRWGWLHRIDNLFFMFADKWLGTIGFLLGLAFAVRLFLRTPSAITIEPDTDHRCRAQACIGALAAIGLDSLVDFNLYLPSNAMFLGWICGLGLAACSLHPRCNPRRKAAPARPALTASLRPNAQESFQVS